jgi:DnaK suppressor protein
MSVRGSRRIAGLRQRLQAECVRLQEEVSRLPIGGVEQIGHGNHMADDASDAFEQAKSLTLRRHLETLLYEVREALQRLDSGTYGRCQACGQPIDSARLEAIPYAALCLHCKVRAERR